jgi:serine/threonine protein phosphatase PrpC
MDGSVSTISVQLPAPKREVRAVLPSPSWLVCGDSDDDDAFEVKTDLSQTWSPLMPVTGQPQPLTSWKTSGNRRFASPSASHEATDLVSYPPSLDAYTDFSQRSDATALDCFRNTRSRSDYGASIEHQYRSGPPDDHDELFEYQYNYNFEIFGAEPLKPCTFLRTAMTASMGPTPFAASLHRGVLCAPPALPMVNCGHYQHIGPRKQQEDAFHADNNLLAYSSAVVGEDEDALNGAMVGHPGGDSQHRVLATHSDAPTFYAGVFDGHNGKQASTHATHMVHEFLRRSPLFATDLEAALVEALRRTDVAMMEQQLCGQSGSTALVACVRGNRLTVANLGDCRAILVSHSGHVTQLTEDHKPAAAVEQRRYAHLQRCGYRATRTLDDGLAVSRGLGDFAAKGSDDATRSGMSHFSNVADTTTLTLPHDAAFVLLATDGLWDLMSNEEAAHQLLAAMERCEEPRACQATPVDGSPVRCRTPTAGDPVAHAVQKLVTYAVHEKSASDNITALLIRVRY